MTLFKTTVEARQHERIEGVSGTSERQRHRHTHSHTSAQTRRSVCVFVLCTDHERAAGIARAGIPPNARKVGKPGHGKKG